jgi:hypothetical protein
MLVVVYFLFSFSNIIFRNRQLSAATVSCQQQQPGKRGTVKNMTQHGV